MVRCIYKLSPEGQEQIDRLWQTLREIKDKLELLEKAYLASDTRLVNEILAAMFNSPGEDE